LVFRFLITLFLVIKRKKSFIFIKPLTPKKLKNSIVYLGASFIKLAQVLATRSDFFSQEYIKELKNLHDQLPPMKPKEFKKVFKLSFKDSPFISFDENPIASASIGQVHVAYLKNNQKVAVKLRRNYVKEKVLSDLKIINFFKILLQPLFSKSTKNSIETVITEFSDMIKEEVNLNIEVNNLLKFREIYRDEKIIFPTPYLEYCSQSAIVMSYEEGFRFDDKENIFKYKIDFNQIISKLVNFYVEQMMIKGFFHADPHPGNLLVNRNGDLIFLDFGMAKKVPNDIRMGMIEMIKASNDKDYELFINANKKLGTISYEANATELAEFTEKMFDIFDNKNLSSESMQTLAFEVLETTKKFPFKLPSDVIYILRVSAILEGLGTTYIENFNGVKDILPILQKRLPSVINNNFDIIKNIKEIPFMLNRFRNVIYDASEGKFQVEISNNQLEWISKEASKYIKHYMISISLFLGAFFTILYDKDLKEISLILFSLGFIRIIYK
jgi:predicted unusual protein kinase regulating ubiquinone biosynthesis (AarF/ABC1/UbiB family)